MQQYINTALGDRGWTLPYDGMTLCAAVPCTGTGTGASFQFFSAGVSTVAPAGHPDWKKLVPDFSFKGSVAFGASSHAQNWDVPGLTLRFAPGASLSTSTGFSANGTMFTASDASQGWSGLRFEPGSGGGLSGVTVERVAGGGQSAYPARPLYDAEAVRVQDASPTFTDLIIRNATPGSVANGLAVYGPTSFPIVTNLRVEGMTGRGVVASAGARPALNRGTFTANAGTAVASVGTGSVVYLAPELVGGVLRGATITGNPGGGITALALGRVTLGVPIEIPGVPPDGFTTVALNTGRGLNAAGGGVIFAGGLDQQRKNSIYGNGPGSPSGNARVSGSGSAVYARCNWWNAEVAPFRTVSLSGALLDVNTPLARNPSNFPNDACESQIIVDNRSAGALNGAFAAYDGSEGVAGRSSATALDRLVTAIAAATPVEAAAQLAALVADEPDTEEAAAAIGQAGLLASQVDAPAEAVALLASSASSAYPALRVAAAQALVASRQAHGDLAGALAATDALASEGAAVQAELARVYLYHEMDDPAQAASALASLEALAPESDEADLARSFLESGGEALRAGRGVAAQVAALGDAEDAALSAVAATTERAAGETVLAVWPNPSSSSGASVSLALAEASEVTVTVYDLLGRVVATPLVGAFAAGEHRAVVEAGVLAPGVYVVRAVVRSGGAETVQTLRLTVVR